MRLSELCDQHRRQRDQPDPEMRDVARSSSSGDLVVLVGAQGMDEGAKLLRDAQP